MNVARHEDSANFGEARRDVRSKAHEEHRLNRILNLEHLARVQTARGRGANRKRSDGRLEVYLRTNGQVHVAGQNNFGDRRGIEGDVKVSRVGIENTCCISRNDAVGVRYGRQRARDNSQLVGNELSRRLRVRNLATERALHAVAKAHRANSRKQLEADRVLRLRIVGGFPKLKRHHPARKLKALLASQIHVAICKIGPAFAFVV